MSPTKFCSDPRCMRHIPEDIFDKATAHALGCKTRKSLAGKTAYAKKEKLRARGRLAAETRAKRRAEGAYKAVTGEELAL